jgi:hypothetical protein
MSNISKINGLDISAADAQYVAAGNVDGPLGYNSIQASVTASYIDPTFISASAAASGFGSGGGAAATSSWAINAITASFARSSSYYFDTDTSTISATGAALQIRGETRVFITASNQITLGAPNGVRIAQGMATFNSAVRMTGLTSASGISHVLTYVPATGDVYFTASSAIGSGGGSVTSASFASTASYLNDLNQNLTINGNLTVFGTASYTLVSASQFNVGTNTISVNVFEPAQRFGGLIVYDSGSLSHQATASLFWDSLHNHWVYQNASGSGYSGGMFMSGPRNTGSLGEEPGLTKWFITRGDGGDHLNDTQIFSSGSVHIVTGSLTVTGNVIATSSWASNAVTASYIDPTFISASAAASGFGSGGSTGPESDPIFTAWSGSGASYFAGTASYALSSAGVAGGVTSITAGTGISIDQSTGNVTITNTGGGGGGGTNLGLVYAVSLGYLMP